MSKRILARRTPRRSAALFKDQVRPNIINQQSEWLDWDGHCYMPVEDATIESEIAEWCDASFEQTIDEITSQKKTRAFNPKPGDVHAIADSLKKLVHKRADLLSPPCWLVVRKGQPDPRNIISVQNGLLDITTRELHPATPEFFNRVSLPLDYNPDAPIPRKWLRFMLQAMARRKPLVRLAQELIGYLISDDTSQQTVIHFWGPPRTGKGTTMRVTTALVGPLNCCNPSIQTLAGRFGLQGCLGKSLIKITDMDCDDKQALGLAATRINAISGEDDVAVERKMLTDWNGRLHGRLMLASNGLPDFGSHTTALAARLVILPFEVSSLGREDRELTDKLLTELPGILNWALDGLARMRARGRFVEPPESVEAKFRMMYASEPVRGLVEEKCVLDADAMTEKGILYAVYKRYCRVTGTYPLALHKFSERMSNLFPSVAPSRRRAGDNRVQVFAGIRLNDAEVCQAYKIDPEMIGLGFDGPDALLLDADGWPVPRFDGDDMVLIGE